MKPVFLAAVLICAAATLLPAQKSATDAQAFSVAVDPRVELLCVVARLARFPEFDRPNGRWAYRDAADAWFEDHRGHAAVRRFRQLHAEHGVSYDAVPSLALHLTALPELAERIPFEPRPERLDERFPLEDTREFLRELRRFVKDAKVAEFFAAQKKSWDIAAQRLSERLKSSAAPAWMLQFHGTPPAGSCVVIPGLLTGPMNFGSGVRWKKDHAEELRPVLGCFEFDAEGQPQFGSGTSELFAHELCHSFTNALVDAHVDALKAAGEAFFGARREIMRRQAYGSPRTVLYETLVRACVLRCILATDGAEAARTLAESDVRNGFSWVPALARSLERYEQDRKRWPRLRDFMPEVIATLDAESKALERSLALAPKLVSISPANGAQDVDPAMDCMTLVFDRPMKASSWSFVARKEDLPEFVGQPSWDAAHKVLTVKMKMQPGRTYRFQLNSPRFQGFVAADGTPLEGVPVSFRTR